MAHMLDIMQRKGFEVRSVGKIIEVFSSRGINKFVRTVRNEDGINKMMY